MRTRLLLVLLAAITAATFWYAQPYLTQWWQTFRLTSQETLSNLDLPLPLAGRAISTPAPLRGPLDQPLGQLTPTGIIAETNRHRSMAGRPALNGSNRLSQAALAKASDILAQQYFDHIGPDGRGPSHWVDEAGYAYIRIAENLALGAFASDQALVQAWMDSPGHRANILFPSLQDIGVAAIQGTFEGHAVWVSVQEFGRPLTDCPAPDSRAHQQVASEQARLRTQSQTIAQTQATIAVEKEALATLASQRHALVKQGNEKITAGNAAIEQGNSEEGQRLQAEGQAKHESSRRLEAEYERRAAALKAQIDDHNEAIAGYNAALASLRRRIDTLNEQVRAFNVCAKE